MENINSQKTIKDKLKHIPLFEDLTDNELNKILNITNVEGYNENQFVIKEGELGNKLYIILSGKVTVLKKTFSDELYTVVDLSDKENAFFGEFSLLDNEKRSASILTKSKCTFLSITKEDFEQVVESDYKIGYIVIKKIAKRLSRRLRAANEDIITLFEALENEIESTE